MLRLPEFTYVRAQTVAEAVEALARYGTGAAVIAGGTDVVPALKRRQFPVQVLVSLAGISALRGVQEQSDGGLAIGALTTLSDVAAHPAIRSGYTALAEAAALVATPAIRNRATIGGNLLLDTRCTYYNQTESWREALGRCLKCDASAPCRVAPGSDRCLAVSASDTAPALIALDARVRLQGPDGTREVPLARFYRNDGITYCQRRPDEVLTAVLLPPPDGLRSTYLKLRRRQSFDFPILGVAAALRLAPDGKADDVRVALGAVASMPILVAEAGTLGAVTAETVAPLAKVAARLAKPMDNADLTLAYRKRMASVLTQRALLHLVQP